MNAVQRIVSRAFVALVLFSSLLVDAPHVFVEVRFLVGGELRRSESVLTDGQGYVEFPITFVAGEEGQWTVEVGVPGRHCRAAVLVAVEGLRLRLRQSP